MNPFETPHQKLDRSVELALLGHRAGEFTRAELVETPEFEWPASWRDHESKEYPRFTTRALPSAEPTGSNRHSVRDFSESELTKHELGQILVPATITDDGRSTPSAGALFPIELYVIAINTELGDGIYHFDREGVGLVHMFEIQSDETKLDSLLGCSDVVNPAAFVVFTSVLYRTMKKYGPRGYRYSLIEAGALAEAIDSPLNDIGLSSVWLGGFDDRRLATLLGLKPELDLEVPLLLMAIGRQ